MTKTCELCPSTSCVDEKNGRTLTTNGRSSFTAIPIGKCECREAFISLENRWDLMEIEDATGLMPPRLLGC